MARLGGRFAGILQVQVDKDKAAALTQALGALGPQGLKVTVEDEVVAEVQEGPVYWLELVGSDQPNIVRDISAALASQSVTVLELNSELSDAPVSGGRLFKMNASIRCPPALQLSDLRTSLESLANSLMVDINLDE